MSGLVFGRSVAALVAPVLVSAIAYKHLHKKKTSNYDVFFSFCDEDAPLAQVLYHSLVNAGICVFGDNVWPSRSEKIGPDLVQAIENSKIFIPIPSPKYASSRRCLDELVQIMECKNDSSRHIVLPIFYRVERHGIDDLGQKVEDDRKRRAVIEVSCLKGWESEKVANGYFIFFTKALFSFLF